MANPPCQSDDGNAAIFTGTNFDTGDSVMLCPACMVSFCATIIEGMTGLPVAALLDAANSGELSPDEPGDGTPSEDDTPDEDSATNASDTTADEDSIAPANS